MPNHITLNDLELSLEDWQVYPPDFRDEQYYRAEFLLGEEAVEAFVRLPDLLSVSVDGAEPIMARFGRVAWQREDPASRRVLAYLFQPDERDQTDAPPAGQPAAGNSRASGLWTKAALQELIAELTRGGLLTEEAAERIAARGDDAKKHGWFELDETRDLEPYRR